MNDELPWQLLPSAVSDLTLFLHDQGLAVHSKQSDTLYGFEAHAAALFLRLEQGESVEQIMAAYPVGKKQDISALLHYCEEILNGSHPANNVHYASAIDYPAGLPPIELKNGRYYRLLGSCFLICTESTLDQDLIHTQLAHFECFESEIAADIVFEFCRSGESITARVNGKLFYQALPVARLYPFLQDSMRVLAYQRLSYLLTLHSAALYKNDLCLLLPGASGSGKSTLTAALLSRGYQLLSDETTVVDLNDLGVYQVPMPIGLKQGSWSLLKSLYPALEKSPVHRRFDGQAVRYLTPKTIQGNAHKRVLATHMIFPQVCDEGIGALIPLTSLAALAKLDASGYQIQDKLGVDKSASILNWLAGLDAYQFSYHHFDQAVEAIEGLL